MMGLMSSSQGSEALLGEIPHCTVHHKKYIRRCRQKVLYDGKNTLYRISLMPGYTAKLPEVQ
jgi:hypothetical protein